LKKKEIEEMQQNIAIILYRQDLANLHLEELNKKINSLDCLRSDYTAKFDQLVSEDGILYRLENVMGFIRNHMETGQGAKNKTNSMCFTYQTLRKYVLDIKEFYHFMNQKINMLVETYKKKGKVVKEKKEEILRIEHQIEAKSKLLLKITEPKSTFEEVIRSFISQSEGGNGSVSPITTSKIQLKKDFPQSGYDNECQEYLVLQKSIHLNNTLLKKVSRIG
jgi:hypothetical protein